MFDLTICQGRVADRTEGAIPGARLAGETLAQEFGLTPTVVGTPSAGRQDDWTEALPEARNTLEALHRRVDETFTNADVPLLVTNTCAASLGTLPALAAHRPEAVVLWVDAHGDFNTPQTTDSGYLGGMVLAAACGLWDSGHGAGINPRQVVLVGARDLDKPEEKLLRDCGATILTPTHSDPATVLKHIAGREVWVHIDWDVLEPGYIPAAYKVPGGLLPRDVRVILEAIPGENFAGIEFAEFESQNPEKDKRALTMITETVSPLLG